MSAPSEPLLTADLGNSRCKLRLWRAAGDARRRELLRAIDLPSRPGLGSALASWAAGGPRPAHAAHCAVAARELEDELVAALGAACGAGAVEPVEPGLESLCRQPGTVGDDRLFAARGALALAPRSALVVNAGTALTVDAVEWRAPRGRFLGGAIAPGPGMLAEALARGAARLVGVEPRPGVPALGRSTPEALLAGVAHGFRGAARELVARVAEESGLGLERVLLTGGARAYLLDPPVLPGSGPEVEPDLVHVGLIAAALDALAARSGR